MKSLFLTCFATLSFMSAAHSQTALDSQGNLPGPPPLPVSQSVIDQAKNQIDGNFGYMDRSGVGGQIQTIWNDTIPSEGVYEYTRCENCVYKVRTREFMVTSVILPKGVAIHSFDVGDGAEFQVKQRADNILAIQPASSGKDTSLQVYTKSGEVYPFYIRSESFNSKNVPDLVVRIDNTGLEDREIIKTSRVITPMFSDDKPAIETEASNDAKASSLEALKSGYTPPPKDASGAATDFVKSAAFDPSKLRGWGDYKLWGDDRLRPETVFRDDQFTYIQFGENWKDIELPTAYVVVDGIDELVNTRIQGSTFIIESTQPLISLKSGQAFLCLQYEGKA
ncbi:TrbG/VirB9 family P-type conjugative transfer protein [Kiloniella laminariae]|uniref:TrbG/VirB9 family P-type conjugative transfer protein n=1 Tax=Kiloniella laminariae TaxID=454162 RepID=UPI000368E99C|nr:TrbG/VirB9 family P-type conjugative transfer protein [Kiloniella laminariae]